MRDIHVATAVRRFLRWAAKNNAAATVKHYRYQLGRFVDHAGEMLVANITPAFVTAWARSFHRVQAVQRLCNWLTRCDRSIAVNPLAGMPKPRMGQRRRVLDRAELVRL